MLEIGHTLTWAHPPRILYHTGSGSPEDRPRPDEYDPGLRQP
jgi:hypothetical protein